MSVNVLPVPERWPHLLLPASSYDRGPGAVPATDLRAAVAAGAFDGLKKALREMTAGEIVAALAHSAMRGRGGSGFPTSESGAPAPGAGRPPPVVVHAYQGPGVLPSAS
jgi:hypothetical protein